MEHQIDIQPLEVQQAQAVAEIHMASQSGTFLTSLGKDFLTLLYAQICQSSCGSSYVALNNDQVIGFIIGTFHTKNLFKEVAFKAPLHFSWLIFKRALGQPIILWQALKTLSYPSQIATSLPHAELLALAVDTPWRNQKVGSQLVRQLVQSMQPAQISNMVVTVDANNNDALRFYKHHKFALVHTSKMYGRPMNHLVLAIQDQNDSKEQNKDTQLKP